MNIKFGRNKNVSLNEVLNQNNKKIIGALNIGVQIAEINHSKYCCTTQINHMFLWSVKTNCFLQNFIKTLPKLCEYNDT